MARLSSMLAAAVLAAALLAGTASRSEAAAPSLETALARALTAPDVDPARTAALALDLTTGEVVFQANADRGLLPASAEKLAVSFAALRILGPRYRFSTEVVGAGRLTGRVWSGDLVLVGHGDPTLALSDLDALAVAVAAAGIRRVTGRVLGDESYFDTRRDAPGWKPTYLGIESRPLSALSVAGARFNGANGSASAAARALTAALAGRGVRVGGKPGAGRAPVNAVLLAVDYSAPLTQVVRLMNGESDNFVSELVLKRLGATAAMPGSTAAGASIVRATLARAGVPLARVRIADGSGLSRFDRMTATSLVAILRAGSSDPAIRGPFVTSLAIAGISGTLKRRLERRPTRSRVIGKTGTTRRASALAGFVRKRYVFAILQNGRPVPYWSARAAQDRFVTVLARQP